MPDPPSTAPGEPPSLSSPLSREEVLSIRSPLLLIFWGFLICAFDINAPKIDIAHDAVGAMLIAVGINRIWQLPVSDPYRAVCKVAFFCVMIAVMNSILAMTPLRSGDPLRYVMFIGYIVDSVGMVCLCYVFHLLSAAMLHGRLARFWKRVTLWVIFFFLFAHFTVLTQLARGAPLGAVPFSSASAYVLITVLAGLVLLVFQLVGIQKLRTAARHRNVVPNACRWCEYDLSASGENRCPECGVSRIPWRDPGKNAGTLI